MITITNPELETTPCTEHDLEAVRQAAADRGVHLDDGYSGGLDFDDEIRWQPTGAHWTVGRTDYDGSLTVDDTDTVTVWADGCTAHQAYVPGAFAFCVDRQ